MKNFTTPVRVLMLCLSFSAASLQTTAQQIEKSLTLSNKEKIGFLEYKPTGYAKEGNVKHPLILFLHGIGERGNGTTELKNVARIGLPRMIKLGHNMTFTWNGKTETFLVLSPQCPRKYGMWPELLVNEMIQYAQRELKVDPNRIYITGLSMGGGGTYRFVSRKQEQASKVAAAATVCAPCTFTDGNSVAKARLPMWSFHAADDKVALASCTESAIRKVNAANPEVKPLKTIWPDGGHGVWDRVYTDTAYKYHGVINIYEWFLGQNKSLKPNQLPVANAGKDQTISRSQATATLNGSASRDNDGKLVRFVWKKISGPIAGKISTTMGSSPSTTVTGLTKPGVYTYELAAVDNRAAFTRDTVQITVTDKVVAVPDTTSSQPVITEPVNRPDTAKPSAPTVPKDTVKPAAPAPKPATPAKPAPKPNKAPVARVTPDQTIPIEWNYFPSVSGYPSTDADGWIALFTWEKISGPDAYEIMNPRSCRTRINKLVPGVYVFRVTAYDNKGASSYADVKITMTKKAAKKAAPVASKAVVETEAVETSSTAVPLTIVTMPAKLTVYPNPASGMVNLEYNSELTGKSAINIYDVSGKLIKSIGFTKQQGLYRHNLEISGLKNGLYYVEVRTGNTTGMQTKLLKR